MTSVERPALTRELIVSTALAAIDEGGLQECTMRRIARRLGVEAMSLYWHVDGKDALLDGVIGLLLADALPGADEPLQPWREGMESFARRFRDVSLAHPRAVPLLAQRAPAGYQAAGHLATVRIAELEEAGLDRISAIRATRIVARYVVGFMLAETGVQASRDRALAAAPTTDDEPAVREIIDDLEAEDQGELFEFGLQALLDGIQARFGGADSG